MPLSCGDGWFAGNRSLQRDKDLATRTDQGDWGPTLPFRHALDAIEPNSTRMTEVLAILW